jgi:hypothetical protein
MSPVLTPADRGLGLVPAPSALQLGVIKQARRRQRRRRLAIAAAMVPAAASAVIFASGGSQRGARPTGSRPPRQFGPGTTESAAAVFAQAPYMGVACHIPNSIACDRVGLAVWLRRPATVSATIAGAPLKLNDPTWSYVAQSGRQAVYVYAGFLHPAGLTTRLHVTPEANTPAWLGSNAPSPTVWFRVDFGRGKIVITHENVFLSAGWG